MRNPILFAAALAAVALAPHAQADEIAQLKTRVAALQLLTKESTARLSKLATGAADVTNKLKFVSVSGTDMKIQGANVYIQRGAPGTKMNGLGNLILGFNTLRGGNADLRTGSENLILGIRNNYSGIGGLVCGDMNAVGSESAVLTGYQNSALGFQSVIATGGVNTTLGTYGFLGSGLRNGVQQAAQGGMVLTGNDNAVTSMYGAVLSGETNTITARCSAIGTGTNNWIHNSDFGAVLTGKSNMIDGAGPYNAILTGDRNIVCLGAIGNVICTGQLMTIGLEKPGKPFAYRAFSTGKFVQ